MTEETILVFPLNYFFINEIEEFAFNENIRIRKITSDELQFAKTKPATGKAGLIFPKFDFVLEEKADPKDTGKYVYQAVSAMRLLKTGNIEYTSICRKKDLKIHLIPIMPCTHGFGGLFYILDPPDLPKLKTLFVALDKGMKDNNFELSLRKFNSSYAKGDIGDTLLDLMIALETLYLSGESEKSFRLRLSMVNFLEDKVENKFEMWHFLKEAYALRSRIVHDGIRMPHRIQVSNIKEPVDVTTFLRNVEDYVRFSLTKFLELKSRNKDLTVLEMRNLIEESIINQEFDWNKI